jgi:hypothetical protein
MALGLKKFRKTTGLRQLENRIKVNYSLFSLKHAALCRSMYITLF